MNIPWYWLSFADDDGFRGGCYVEANGPTHPLFPDNHDPMVLAVSKSHVLGINPGGQVAGFPIPDEHLPAPEFRNRLLSKTELREMGGYCKANGESA